MKAKKLVNPEITERIKSVIGKDKKAFAAKVGISYEAIRLWCKGNFFPGGDHLIKIKEKTGVDINWLLFGVSDKKENNFMCGWPEETIRACNELKEILADGEKDEVDQVLFAIKQAKKIRDLKKPVAGASSERRKKRIIK